MASGRDAGGNAAAEDVDHYAVLGLPSGEEGARLTLKGIEKAYRSESRKRHPDKRPDDPNATADFQLLTSSFEVLRDDASRKAFDARLRARLDRVLRESQHSTKRRKFASDLEERERAAAASAADSAEMAERRQKKVAAELQKELADFQARNAKKSTPTSTSTSGQEKGEENGGVGLDKERALKVSWERAAGDYGAVKLRELFERFGGVEDVVIRSNVSKKKGSAIVLMSSKEAAVAATRSLSGNLSNPLLVLPIHAAPTTSSTFSAKCAETISPKLRKTVGAGFQDYEASILKKLEKDNGWDGVLMPEEDVVADMIGSPLLAGSTGSGAGAGGVPSDDDEWLRIL